MSPVMDPAVSTVYVSSGMASVTTTSEPPILAVPVTLMSPADPPAMACSVPSEIRLPLMVMEESLSTGPMVPQLIKFPLSRSVSLEAKSFATLPLISWTV